MAERLRFRMESLRKDKKVLSTCIIGLCCETLRQATEAK